MALDDYATGRKKIRDYTKQQLTNEILNGNFIGLVKCNIECPKNTFIHVLPSDDTNKLMFDLLDKTRKVYATPELKYALENGYKITHLYNCYCYKKHKGLFKQYVECFYKMKIENTEHYTEEQCININKSFSEKGLDIEIKSEDTCSNPGMRGMAKLFLNSLWGKFGTRELMSEYTYVRSVKELWEITSDTKKKLTNFHIIHDNLVEVSYERNCDITDCADYVSPITAVFTTSNARVRLAKFLRVLHPSQLLYADTDSCYFAYNPKNENHINPETADLPKGVELGDGLGCWETELSDGVRFCGCGAKSYAVDTKDPKNETLKVKGLTIDFSNKDKITFEAMAKIAKSINDIPIEQQQKLFIKKDLKKKEIPFIETNPRFKFNYNKKAKEITTTNNNTKLLQNTVGLKRFVKNNISYPYGYDGEFY